MAVEYLRKAGFTVFGEEDMEEAAACLKQLENEIGESNRERIMEDKKYLVAYFSHGGHAKSIAERVATFMGGDLWAALFRKSEP